MKIKRDKGLQTKKILKKILWWTGTRYILKEVLVEVFI